jgi:5,10-methylenetetrahydrofolate reductase
MSLVNKIRDKGFVFTYELVPPKGVNYQQGLAEAEKLSPLVEAVNITDGQSANMRMGSLPLSYLLLNKGIEPIMQLTCRDRNRIALQSELINAASLGIRNVLSLTGDHVGLGDHPGAKPVFDLDSVSLLLALQKLNQGVDLQGNALNGKTDLCGGAVVNPNVLPAEPQILKMKRKIQSGAQFFQTQPVFDTTLLKPFTEIAQEAGTPLLASVFLLRSVKTAKFINERIAGMHVPTDIVSVLESDDPQSAGLDIAARLVRESADICQGVHLMTGCQPDLARRIIEMSDLSSVPDQ